MYKLMNIYVYCYMYINDKRVVEKSLVCCKTYNQYCEHINLEIIKTYLTRS